MLGRLKRLARLVALTGAALLVLAVPQAAAAPRTFSLAPAAIPGGSPHVSRALRGGPLAAISRVEQPLASTDAVTNCSDSSTPTPGSLRYEVANASAGDTITFALPSSCNGLITLTAGAIEIAQNLTIDGPGASALAVSGNTTNSSVGTTVLSVASGVTAAISGLTIEDGEANQGVGCQGGGIYNSGTLSVTDATLSDNSSPNCGGGGVFNNGGTLTIIESTLSGNSGQTGGGGIYSESGSVTLTDSILSDNSGGQGAGIDNASGTVTLTGSTVSHSGLSGTGAGILNDGTLNVTHGSTVSDNSVTGAFGGGIFNSGTLNVTDSTVSGNRALNEAGGGIANTGTATITDSTLSGNTAPGAGGGIYNEDSDAAVNVIGSTLSGNSTDSWGGAIGNQGTASVTDSTLSGNSASENGGGIANDGTLNVTHGTLSGNTTVAGDGGGISIWDASTATVAATILANSGAGLDCAHLGTSGVLTDLGYNLDDDGSCKFSGTSLSDTAAGLDPAGLQYNGGPTETIALESGSAAIDHVTLGSDCLGSDQRGVAWPTPCDIGAVGAPMTTATTTSTSLSGGGQSGATMAVPENTAVSDTATLSGANASTATGTVTYSVYSDSGCTTAVRAGTAQSITTPGTLPASSAVKLGAPGTYYWQASYSGNSANAASISTCGSEVETVTSPTATTTLTSLSGAGQSGASMSVPENTAVSDTATLSGANASTATGTVTYSVYSDSGCTTGVSTGTVQSITTPGTLPASSAVKLGTPGTYYWQASYSGDSANAASMSVCGSEVETVISPAIGRPSAHISSPADGQTFNLNQSVATSFSCSEASGGPGIKSCADSNGDASPGALHTSTAGTFTYTATASSEDGQTGTASVSYTVARGSQAIAFSSRPPTTAVAGGPPYAVAATGGRSDNPVTFASATSGVCTVSGSTVSFVGAGTCTIDAHQAGNLNYTAAPTATQSFAVAASNQEQELCVVPKLKGKRLAAATRALKKAHCAVGRITKRKSSTLRKGRVISSSPSASSRHHAGTKIALTVSRGKH
jgi:hypothetical protein